MLIQPRLTGTAAVDLSELSLAVMAAGSVFTQVFLMWLLMRAAGDYQPSEISVGGDVVLATDWVSEYLEFLLAVGRGGLRAGSRFGVVAANELKRRAVHAECLKYGTWVAASPTRTRGTTGAEDRDLVVKEWMLRGIVLGERFLKAFCGDAESLQKRRCPESRKLGL